MDIDVVLRDSRDNQSYVHVHPRNMWKPIHPKLFGELDFLRYHKDYRVAEDVRRYVPLIFVVVGTLGNLLSLIVLLRPRMRIKSTFAFLAVLAVADTVVLYLFPFRIWLGVITENSFDKYSTVCQTVSYFSYVFSEFSAGILVLVTVERFIVVKNPLQGPLLCNVHKAYMAMGVLLVALLLLHSHLFWTMGTREFELHGHNMTMCGAVERYDTLVNQVWPWVDICMYSLIPFIVIVILNVLIIRKTRGAGRARRLMSGSSTSSTGSSTEDSSRLTFMLLILTFAFLLTTLPLCVCVIATTLRRSYVSDHMAAGTHRELAVQNLGRAVTQLLMFANHSMNFFLYCLTGNKFRQEMAQLMCCKVVKRRKRGSYSTGSTTCTLNSSINTDRNRVRPGQPRNPSYQMNRLS